MYCLLLLAYSSVLTVDWFHVCYEDELRVEEGREG